MRGAIVAGTVALLGASLLALGADPGRGSDSCRTPIPYPGDAVAAAVADWMAHGARARGIPAELPVMASLVESGLKNVTGGDADSVGFFQMRTSIWNTGPYAGFPTNPELQLTWFIDQALAVRSARVAGGDPGYGADPARWGEWVADVQRPAQELRGRYQQRLEEARGLVGVCESSPEPLAVTTEALPPATVGRAYRTQLGASGAATPTWSLANGALPAGLALAPDGTLAGTPTAATPAPVALIFAVASGAQVATRALALDVVEPLVVPRPAVGVAERGLPLGPVALAAVGGRSPHRFELVAAPAWVRLTAAARLVGTPPRAGRFSVRVAVTDAYATRANVDLILVVRPKLRVVRTPLPVAVAGRLYRVALHHVGGVGPLRWKAAGLPAGLTLDRTTGRLAGRPTRAGLHSIVLTAVDRLGGTASWAARLRVKTTT